MTSHPAEAPPGPPNPRRAEILGAAAELFARRGYHGASIGDLGRAVGLTGPALYRHFSGKEAVLAEMLLDISERLLAEGLRRAAEPDPGRAIDALLSWHIAFALDNPALITVHERELDNVPEPQRHRIRRLQRAYVEEWVAVLRRLSPRLPDERIRAAVHACFGLLNSTPRSAAQGLDRAAMADLLHGMARTALAAADSLLPENASPDGRAGTAPAADRG
ncbi:TetR/AcrR family transcriptional regulator [Actinomadura luteofluorescens]|uniref:TetR/AcrR family transcriptional regulator n=1 Tax=Actinomadura luteofluorescens TaxID=46163 RepID=UPI002164ADC0|nr:TetR/AcrR family transcriptional regulator [Actinomadura glauciflava]MCR3741170.1 transcriptional regulator, TetR family [Actinomadura glauciflava]